MDEPIPTDRTIKYEINYNRVIQCDINVLLTRILDCGE